MPASQINAKAFNPNSLSLVQVASYERIVDAPLNRAWENVLDWAHLPYLHETTFNYIEVAEAGDWGWRTWSNEAHTAYVELTVADKDRYVARSYQAGLQVSEIWTTLTAAGEQTRVHVDFHFPDIEPASIAAMGEGIRSLYIKLWNEDEAMMRQRHTRLLEKRDNATEVNLGSEVAVFKRLEATESIIFQLQRREYQLRELNGRLIAHTTICPHLLGPLTDADLSTGKLRCPWHGYEFDIETGECVLPGEADCTLAPAPKLLTENGNVIARML